MAIPPHGDVEDDFYRNTKGMEDANILDERRIFYFIYFFMILLMIKKTIIGLFVMFFFVYCKRNRNDRSNYIYMHSEKVKNLNIYNEEYLVRTVGGAHGGSIYAHYITDSARFRKYIGERDDKEYFDISKNGDLIVVIKIERISGPEKAQGISIIQEISKDTFLLSNLVRDPENRIENKK